MARSLIATDTILVRCLPARHYRCRASGQVYFGDSGKQGRPDFVAGSPPFQIPRWRWDRDAGLPSNDRLFTKVGE